MSDARTNSGLFVLSNNLTFGTGYTYNAQTNKIEHATVENTSVFKVAEYSCSSDGTITDFKPYNAFMAVDYNEFENAIKKTDCVAYIVKTHVNAKVGYNIYSNNYCEQWGYAQAGKVSFPKPFKDTNYGINTTAWDDGSAEATSYADPTTTSFTLRTAKSDHYASWKAWGYIS